MHDPLIVAFEIRRPWPCRNHSKFGPRWRWPEMVTVWHREPGNKDSGVVCKMHRSEQQADGTWKHRYPNGWRFHVHHWHLQVHALQRLRRQWLTRCAWCGGKQAKGDPINIGTWNGKRGHWWQGEPGVQHHDCSTVAHAHTKCLCDRPEGLSGGYGVCSACGRFRAWGSKPDEADRLLAALPAGSRIPVELRPKLTAIWDARLRAEGTDPKSTVSPW
jgi:hypothetical protein